MRKGRWSLLFQFLQLYVVWKNCNNSLNSLKKNLTILQKCLVNFLHVTRKSCDLLRVNLSKIQEPLFGLFIWEQGWWGEADGRRQEAGVQLQFISSGMSFSTCRTRTGYLLCPVQGWKARSVRSCSVKMPCKCTKCYTGVKQLHEHFRGDRSCGEALKGLKEKASTPEPNRTQLLWATRIRK